jgi:hypothetical protein
MLAYDLRSRATAARMLAPIASGGKGQVVTLHQPATDGVFDPATDTTSGGSPPTDHTGSGVEEAYSAYSLAQGLVLAGDVKFLLSPLKADGTPMPQAVADSWTITKGLNPDGSPKVWAIKRVEPLSPAGTPVLFELQLRS